VKAGKAACWIVTNATPVHLGGTLNVSLSGPYQSSAQVAFNPLTNRRKKVFDIAAMCHYDLKISIAVGQESPIGDGLHGTDLVRCWEGFSLAVSRMRFIVIAWPMRSRVFQLAQSTNQLKKSLMRCCR
jgi:hypothetical protein